MLSPSFQGLLRFTRSLNVGFMGGAALAMLMTAFGGVSETRLIGAVTDMLFLKTCDMSTFFTQWDGPVAMLSLIHGLAPSEGWLYVLFVGHLLFFAAIVTATEDEVLAMAPEDKVLIIDLWKGFVYTMLWGISRKTALLLQMSDLRRQSFLFMVAVTLHPCSKPWRAYLVICGVLIQTLGCLLEEKGLTSKAEVAASHLFVKRTSDGVVLGASFGSAAMAMIFGGLITVVAAPVVAYRLQRRNQRPLPLTQNARRVSGDGNSAGQPPQGALPAPEPAHLPGRNAD